MQGKSSEQPHYFTVLTSLAALALLVFYMW